jgi:glutamate-1-semialdehyde 2,1-aminomutase
MKKINKIFFSGTFAGEISSLYACEATIKYMIKYNVLDNILKKGIFLQKELNKIIKRNNLDKILSFTGHPSWLFLKIENNKYFDGKLCKAYIMQELIENNILFFGSFNLSFSHTLNDLKKVINLMDKIFYNLDKNKKSLKNFVKIRIPKSAFVVRKV